MHILLVEDEDELRSLLAQLLSRTGHVVRAAASGQEARRLLREAPSDLLITDIIMPTEDGLELMMKVRQQFPDMDVIGMSGSSAHSPLYLKIAGKLGALVTLQKPFSMDELLLAIARVELARATKTRSKKS